MVSSALLCCCFVLCLSVLGKIDPMHGVLGFSSGAYFAVQYQFSYSSQLRGAAIYAGGPYYCAQDSFLDAVEDCMSSAFLINLQTLEGDAQSFASQSQIDQLSNLVNHNIFLYSGELDFIVSPAVVKSLQQMYQDFNVSNITTQYGIAGTHGFPTTNYGASCSSFGTPFIVNCNYDGAGAGLASIFGTLRPRGTQVQGNLITVDQSKFTPNGVSPSSISLDNNAYLYVPTACNKRSTPCKILVAFHGCEQYYQTVGDAWVRYTGLNDWAETNNIFILYPQTISSTFDPTNSNGCWDWWGYNEAGYATQGGSQMTTVKNMIKFLIGNYSAV